MSRMAALSKGREGVRSWRSSTWRANWMMKALSGSRLGGAVSMVSRKAELAVRSSARTFCTDPLMSTSRPRVRGRWASRSK